MTTGTQTETRFNVGGVFMDRPFKIRRMGHFGFYVRDLEESKRFYGDTLGFAIGDAMAGRAYFLRHGTDHHSGALFLRPESDTPNAPRPGVTIQQLSWQIQTLEEMVTAVDWFKKLEVPQANIGRGMPGSNWHTYPSDPDGHRNEIFYGMEQVGWQGVPKPQDMYYRRFRERPELPQVSEGAEVRDAIDRGIDLLSGYRDTSNLEATYEVDGILLPRPFKITHVGPVGLFVENMENAIAFYVDVMGFIPTETVCWENATCHFLRCSTEHHSVALYPLSLRERLGLAPTTTCAGLGIRVANYRQLRAAVEFVQERGYRVETDLVPPALTPGMDYTAYVFDPDGNPVVLHCYMEQVGWDGRPRAAADRRTPERWPWPEVVEPVADVYMGEPFLGPFG